MKPGDFVKYGAPNGSVEQDELDRTSAHLFDAKHALGDTGWRRWNVFECDMDEGPCACGAWHDKSEERVKRWPLYRKTWA